MNQLGKSLLVFICLVLLFNLPACITVKVKGNSPSQTGNISFTQAVNPSNSYQEIDAGGVKVIIPGYTLKKTETLSVNSISSSQPADFKAYKALATYRISLGNLHRFSPPLVIRIKCDPSMLSNSSDTKTNLAAALYDTESNSWRILPSSVDTKTGEIIIKTDHLSDIQLGSWETGKGSISEGSLPLNDFKSVSLAMEYDGYPVTEVKDDLGFMPGSLLEAKAATVNIPAAAYYLWQSNGNIIAKGIDIKSAETKLSKADTVYIISLQISQNEGGPLLAQTSRSVKIGNPDIMKIPAVVITTSPEEIHKEPTYWGHTYNGFSGAKYTFAAELYNCPQGTRVRWQFSDGGSAEGTSASHTFNAAGSYTVTAIAEWDKGTWPGNPGGGPGSASSLPMMLYISDKPGFEIISPAPGAKVNLDEDVQFAVRAKGSNATNSGHLRGCNVAWDFGDGTSGNTYRFDFLGYADSSAKTAHSYKKPGKYTIKATVMDSEAANDWVLGSATSAIEVLSTGSCVKISPERLDGDMGTHTFTATSSYANAEFIWDINGSVKQSGPKNTLSVNFNKPGQGSVSVAVKVDGKEMCKASCPVTIFEDLKAPQTTAPASGNLVTVKLSISGSQYCSSLGAGSLYNSAGGTEILQYINSSGKTMYFEAKLKPGNYVYKYVCGCDPPSPQKSYVQQCDLPLVVKGDTSSMSVAFTCPCK